MKIAVITCYNQPDYIRARVLRAALAQIPDVEVITIKNTGKGVKRYPEVLWKVLKTRLREHPDAFLLTFRGYEMLLPIRLLTLGKPLIFDELVNLIEWVVYEHKKLGGLPGQLLGWFYHLLLKSCRIILADTESHAEVSSQLSKIDRRRYWVVPVGTDESVFHYREPAERPSGQPFTIFFYGYMLPLHGPLYVVRAAELLKDNPDINFLIAGRTKKYLPMIEQAKARGARIEHRDWVPFEELPQLIASAGVNIAGPFGNTFQARHVINGKVYQFLASGSLALLGEGKNTQDFINHENCLIIPQGSAEAIAREIEWAYRNPDKIPAIIRAGRKLYDEKYSNKVLAESLEQMLKSLYH